jgi:RND family efflux transporter MFP subunit
MQTLRNTLAASCSLALVLGCKSAPPPAVPTPVVPVATAGPASMQNDIDLTAEFLPFQEVDVMAKVAGYVRSINVDIGSHVTQGEVLATLEVPEIQDDVAKAKSGVAAAQANVTVAQAGIQRAQAGANIAKLSYDRLRDVATKDKGLVPKQDLDVAQSKQLEAAAMLASAQSELKSAQQSASGAQSEYSRAQTMYQYATIRAPFAGVVTKRYANTGAMIQAGISSQSQAMPIVRLAQDNVLRLDFPVPVNAVAEIHNGEPVDVLVSSSGRKIEGTVTRFADSVQTSTRTMNTEVDVPNADGKLIPGMYAQVHLHLADIPDALSVPIDGVDGLGTSVQQSYVVRNGVVHLVTVTVGIQTPNRVEILSGLKAGDRVIVGRHTGLFDGEHVDAQPAGYENNQSN